MKIWLQKVSEKHFKLSNTSPFEFCSQVSKSSVNFLPLLKPHIKLAKQLNDEHQFISISVECRLLGVSSQKIKHAPRCTESTKTRRNGMNLQHHRKSFSNESSSSVGPESQYLAGDAGGRCVRFNRHHVLPSRTQKVRKSLSSGKALTKQHLMNGCDAQIFWLVVCWVTRHGIREEVHLNFRKMIENEKDPTF